MAADEYTHRCPICNKKKPCAGMRWSKELNAYIHYINCTAVCAEEQADPTPCDKGKGLGYVNVLSRP